MCFRSVVTIEATEAAAEPRLKRLGVQVEQV